MQAYLTLRTHKNEYNGIPVEKKYPDPIHDFRLSRVLSCKCGLF